MGRIVTPGPRFAGGVELFAAMAPSERTDARSASGRRVRFYDPVKRAMRFLDGFWSRVERTDGCWNWLGSRNRDGYGSARFAGRHIGAHRVAYMAVIGRIPPGTELDHTCRNRACVNPAHLDPVTHAENVARGDARQTLKRVAPLAWAATRARTHCKHGHPLAGENLLALPNGWRWCKTCRQASYARYRARKKVANV